MSNINFDKAVELFYKLPSLRSVLDGNYLGSMPSESSCILEKYMGILAHKMFREVFNKELSLNGLVRYRNELDYDFVNIGEEPGFGVYDCGDSLYRGYLPYSDYTTLFSYLKSSMTDTSWSMDWCFSDLVHLYFYLEHENGDEFEPEEYEDFFSTRNNLEFVDDIGLSEFFLSSDINLYNEDVGNFFSNTRTAFTADEYSGGFVIFFRSKLLHYYLYIDESTLITEEAKRYYQIISDCIDVLAYTCFFGGNSQFIMQKDLTYSYISRAFFISDEGYYSNDDRFGCIAIDPRMFLVPVLVDECIYRLDKTLHILPEEVR